MNNLIEFFHQIGKLKEMPRRGWVIRDVKNPESIAEHIFRVSIMAWILGDVKTEKLNIEKVIKIALIHDLCEVYAGDTTPYDSILPKSKKGRQELLKTWPRFSETQRNKLADDKYKKEKKGLEKLIEKLPPRLKNEIKNLWLDYEKGLTPEGRFFKQADRLENLLQALEYSKKYKNFPYNAWLVQARELFDDSVLLNFIEEMNNKFYRKRKAKV